MTIPISSRVRIAALCGQPWAMRPDVFEAGRRVLDCVLDGSVRADGSADPRARVLADRFGKAGVMAVASVAPPCRPGEFASFAQRDLAAIAIVPVSGVLMRHRADVTDSSGETFGTAYEDIVAGVEMAAADDRVGGIMLAIDSPGGLASPCADAFGRIRAASERSGKPVWAFGIDGVYSAALYMAAAAERVLLTDMTGVGSIGSIVMVPNYVEQLAAQGVRFEVIKSAGADAKDAGNPVRDFTDADRDQLQRDVDALGVRFYDDLALGMGVSRERVLEWAARTEWRGQAAVDAGMAHGVVSGLRDAVAAMAAYVRDESRIRTPLPGARGSVHAAGGAQSSNPLRERHTMTYEELAQSAGGAALIKQIQEKAAADALAQAQAAAPPAVPAPAPAPAASIAELKAAFPDDAPFALTCAEKGLSLLAARAEYAGVLAAKLEASAKAAAEAAARAEQAEKALADRHGIVERLREEGVTPGHKGVAFKPDGAAAQPATGGRSGPAVSEAEREFLSLAAQIKAERRCDELTARGMAARQNPELHRRYLTASSASIRDYAGRIGAIGRPASGV